MREPSATQPSVGRPLWSVGLMCIVFLLLLLLLYGLQSAAPALASGSPAADRPLHRVSTSFVHLVKSHMVTGSDTWSPVDNLVFNGGQVLGVAAHPTISGTLYAAVSNVDSYDSSPSTLYKSEDGGASWVAVLETMQQLYSVAAAGSNVYAGAFNTGDTHAVLYASQDSGITWMPVLTLTNRGVFPSISVAAFDPDTAVAGGWAYDNSGEQSGRVYRTSDGGLTWNEVLRVTYPGSEGQIDAVMIHPITPTLVYAAVRDTFTGDSSIYRSSDGGFTWSAAFLVPGAQVMSFAANTLMPEMIYAGTGSTPMTGGPSQTYRSLDGGLTWTAVFTEAGGDLLFVPPTSVFAAPNWGQIWYSDQSGEPGTWISLGNTPGVASFTADLLANALYVGTYDQGVSKSSDNGLVWNPANNNIWTPVTARNVVVDPLDANTLFVAGRQAGGWLSDDGTASWTQVMFRDTLAFAINPANDNVVYAGVSSCNDAVVQRSSDGGLTYTPVYTPSFFAPDCSNGSAEVYATAVSQSSPNIVYAAGVQWPAGGPSEAFVARSLDNGFTWNAVWSLPASSRGTSLAIDPLNANVIFAGGEDCSSGSCEGVVYRSDNGGVNWNQVLSTEHTVKSIVIDWANSDNVYVADEGYEVRKSSDGGDTWTVILANWLPPDYPPSGDQLAVDPNLPNHIYVAGWGYIGESSDGGQTWSRWDAPINNGMPPMPPNVLAVDYGFPVQTLYSGPNGLYAYTRAAPQFGNRYVAISGTDDLNACTDPGNPCRTIAYAVSIANPGEIIRVAQGTYLENLTINKSLTLEGGYEAVGWTRNIDLYETIIDGSNSPTIPGDWDGSWMFAPTVISDTGAFRMWFSGSDDFGNSSQGEATSLDGVTWTKNPGNPLLPGFETAVLKEGPSDYKMWVSRDGGIYRAVSADGLVW
ncbi:MAG: hypothetical protein R3E31_22685 [Chloroflexota bacterium]